MEQIGRPPSELDTPLQVVSKDRAPGDTSDGYHTFDELYNHRRALTALLFAARNGWRSRAHHPDDSPCYEGYFIVGLDLPTGMITYHYADQFWDDFQALTDLPHAPKWDGAEPNLTVTRLIDAARSYSA